MTHDLAYWIMTTGFLINIFGSLLWLIGASVRAIKVIFQ